MKQQHGIPEALVRQAEAADRRLRDALDDALLLSVAGELPPVDDEFARKVIDLWERRKWEQDK